MKSNFRKNDSRRAEDLEAAELAYWLQNSAPNDPAVLERLVNRYAAELYRWVEILVYSRLLVKPTQEDVLNILKKVFETAIRNVEQFHGSEQVYDWLFSIAYKVAREWYFIYELKQNVTPRKSAGDSSTLFTSQAPFDTAALEWIPEKIRSALILRYLFDLELLDIASICDKQEKEIHTWLVKGRKQLFGSTDGPHMKDKIQAFVDGMLERDLAQMDVFNLHMAECELCQQALHNLESLEQQFSEQIKERWVVPVLTQGQIVELIHNVRKEVEKTQAGLSIKIPLRQASWIIGLALLLAGFAFISIRLIPIDNLPVEPTGIADQQLPPVVEIPQPAGEGRNQTGMSGAPQYIAPSFSADGKWAVFATTNFSLSSPSVILQDIELYSQEANTIQVITESTAFFNSWVWWDRTPSISADGRWVVYVSIEKGQVSGSACSTTDFRNCLDIYLYDRINRTDNKITRGVSGGGANGDSLAPTISADGQWVAFWSTADNLVDGFTNTCKQNGISIACLYIYLYNVPTGKISWIPVPTIPGDNVYGVDRISLSADGRYIGFTISSSAQLGIPAFENPQGLSSPGETSNGSGNTFVPPILHSSEAIVYDRLTGKYELENQGLQGTPGDGPSSSPVLSADGRFVAFVSASTNLVEGDTNDASDIFVRDRQTGKIELASVSSVGEPGQGDSGYIFSSRGYYSLNISSDGRYVVFESSAGNLIGNWNLACSQAGDGYCHYLYLHDRQAGTTELISELFNRDFTLFPQVTNDGNLISYMQFAHACDMAQSQCSNIMVYDRQIHWTTNLTKNEVQTPTLPWSYSGSFSIPWQTWESPAFALSPDGTQIALGGYDSKVRIWQSSDVNSITSKSEPDQTLPVLGIDSFSALVYSPNGEWLAGGTAHGSIYVWQLSSGDILYSNQNQADQIRKLVFTGDGSQLIVGTQNQVWTWRLGDEQMNLVGGFSTAVAGANTIDISPDGKIAASIRSDGTIWLQDLPDGNVISRLNMGWLTSRSLAFSHDGNMLAAQSPDGMIGIWNVSGNGDEVSYIPVANRYNSFAYNSQLVFSADDKYLVSSRSPGDITLWSIPDGKVYSLSGPVTDGRVYSIVFGEHGDKLVALFENVIALWGIPNHSSSTFFAHATNNKYIDTKPTPEATANDVPGLESAKSSLLLGNLNLNQVEMAISFPLMIPAHLPGNIEFKSASINKDGSVLLFYRVIDQQDYQAGLYIYEQKISGTNPPTMTIGTDASVALTHVATRSGDTLAEFVSGDWMWRQSYTPPGGNSALGDTHVVWDWDSLLSSGRLRWQQDGILIGLYYQVFKPYYVLNSPWINGRLKNISTVLDQSDLTQIASGMVPYLSSQAVGTLPQSRRDEGVP